MRVQAPEPECYAGNYCLSSLLCEPHTEPVIVKMATVLSSQDHYRLRQPKILHQVTANILPCFVKYNEIHDIT